MYKNCCHCSYNRNPLLLFLHSLDAAVKQVQFASGRRLAVTEEKKSKNTGNILRIYDLHPSLWHSVCFRRYTWLAVSCGTETVWVIGGGIDDGIAHNHSLLCSLLPISICLVSCLTAAGQIGENSAFEWRPPCCRSLGKTTKIWSVTPLESL